MRFFKTFFSSLLARFKLIASLLQWALEMDIIWQKASCYVRRALGNKLWSKAGPIFFSLKIWKMFCLQMVTKCCVHTCKMRHLKASPLIVGIEISQGKSFRRFLPPSVWREVKGWSELFLLLLGHFSDILLFWKILKVNIKVQITGLLSLVMSVFEP